MIIHDVGKAPFYMVSIIPPTVSKYLKYTVKPVYRYFENGGWHVHKDYLSHVVNLAQSVNVYADYSSLPEDIQIDINLKKSQSSRDVVRSDAPPTLTSAYAELHLLPSAPQSVIKAAYKALVSLHHPDKGGDADKFIKISEAYQKIVED